VGRKLNILDLGRGIRVLDQEGNQDSEGLCQVALLALVALVALSAVVLIRCIQLYMDNHMFLVGRSNAGLQDISCNRLHRYCIESTTGSRSDVERTLRILGQRGGKLVHIFRLRGIHLHPANLFHMLQRI
jgi:hypothetical protein